MAVNNQTRAFGTFAELQAAEQAITELKNSGFPMEKVSLIARDADDKGEVGGVQMSDNIGGKDVDTASGAVANTLAATSLGAVMLGLGSMAIPGVGMVIAAGSAVAVLAATTASTGVEAAAISGLVKTLTNLGLPEEQARLFSDRLHAGDYLVIVDGTEDELRRAEGVLSQKGIKNWGIYTPTNA